MQSLHLQQNMTTSIIDTARNTIESEARSLLGLLEYLDANFEKAVQSILTCKGRFVISGIGKSALIAQKIVASLNSTGTPSMFLHAAEAIHGDIGMVQNEDVVMIISKSGDSPEIKVLIPIIRNFKNTIIAMCGNKNSYLVKSADIFINTTVTEEACPNNLAPTSSTAAQMAMGDALAVCLMNLRGFTAKDFAKFHPGGTLGKKLYLHVSDLSKLNEKPSVKTDEELRNVIVEITKKRLGVTVVLEENGEIAGIITDGDLRRMLENQRNVAEVTAADIMTENPKTVAGDELAVNALEIMRRNNITQLVVTEKGKYTGIVHLHDIVREGII